MKTGTAVAVMAIMTAWPVMAQQSQSVESPPRITVNGEAAVYVIPDRITVALGIET